MGCERGCGVCGGCVGCVGVCGGVWGWVEHICAISIVDIDTFYNMCQIAQLVERVHSDRKVCGSYPSHGEKPF